MPYLCGAPCRKPLLETSLIPLVVRPGERFFQTQEREKNGCPYYWGTLSKTPSRNFFTLRSFSIGGFHLLATSIQRAISCFLFCIGFGGSLCQIRKLLKLGRSRFYPGAPCKTPSRNFFRYAFRATLPSKEF